MKSEQTKVKKRSSFRFAWKASFGIAIVAPIAWLFFGGLMPLYEKHMELRQLSEEVNRLKDKNKDLVEKKHLLEKDREYQERVIRNELGMVRPNEVIVWLGAGAAE